MLAVQSSIRFRSLVKDDLDPIVRLVATHDEDDAEEVADSLSARNFANHYVMLLDEHIIGITGFVQQPECDRTFYLSWTYLHDQHCGKGYGRQLLEYLLTQLQQIDARKIFVKISDYQDPEDGPVYESALALYKKLGFTEEALFSDYYDSGESMTILGLRLAPESAFINIQDENPKLKFCGLFCVPETEHTYSFEWQNQSGFLKKNFNLNDLNIGLEAAHNEGAHQVVLSFPCNFSGIQRILLSAGFSVIGRLKNYYQDGVDEVHYQYTFKNTK